MDKNSYHVVPSPEGGWSVRKADSVRASKLFETQKEAVEWACKIAAGQAGELVIHKHDGTIRSKEIFKREPTPPVDTLQIREEKTKYSADSSKKKSHQSSKP